ncbi:hypothetical protein CR513_12600, partial [Mucuna pruriens]
MGTLPSATWNEREEVWYQYGRFPNIPLIGTQGYINYNLALLLRQSGYPMLHPPSKELMTPLIVHGMGPYHTGILQNIQTAWGQAISRGINLGPRSCGVSTDRVEKIQLPFSSSSSMGDVLQEPSLTKGKEIVEAMNKEEDLKREMEAANKGQKRAWEEVDKERKIDEQMAKHARIEDEIRLRTKECLKAADLEMAKRDQALLEKQELIKMLMEAKREEKEHLGWIELLEQQIEHLNTELLRECLTRPT